MSKTPFPSWAKTDQDECLIVEQLCRVIAEAKRFQTCIEASQAISTTRSIARQIRDSHPNVDESTEAKGPRTHHTALLEEGRVENNKQTMQIPYNLRNTPIGDLCMGVPPELKHIPAGDLFPTAPPDTGPDEPQRRAAVEATKKARQEQEEENGT